MVGVVMIFTAGRDGNLDRSGSSIAISSSLADRSSDCDGAVVGDEVDDDRTGLKVMLEITMVV